MNTYKKISHYVLLIAVAIILLGGCKQSNPASESATTYSSSQQFAADVKQAGSDAGSAIANHQSRLTGSLPVTKVAKDAIDAKDSKLPNLRSVQTAYSQQASRVQVEDSGRVAKVLADDNEGLRHQKFLVKTASGQTLLFAHNLDLAPRVDNIKVGDTIEFRGEYIYNEKGGVVHWTHRDPQHHHYDGWIKHDGVIYQ